MTLRRISFIGAIIAAIIIAAIGLISFASLSSFQRSFDELLTHTIAHSELLRDIRADGIKLYSSTNELVLGVSIGVDSDDIEAERGEINDTVASLRTLVEELSQSIEDDDAEGVAESVTAVEALIASSISVADVAVASRSGDIAEFREEMEETEEAFEAALIVALAGETELVQRTKSETIAALEQTRTILLLAAIALPVVLLFVISYMGNLQSTTAGHIVEQANRIRQGDYASRIALSQERLVPSELSALADNMNALAGAVQQREGDLKQINETLERRVRERTREAEGARRVAEENNRLKSEFLATMSHELRTPLNAIEGFTSIIRNRMGGADFNEKTGRYIERIEANSKRLLGLVNDFLDISRIESGRLQLASLPFSPADAAQKWASQIGVLADKKGVAFDLTLDPALPDQIVGDEEAVSKMALNLLSNAIKFTEQGKVSLDVRATGSGGWQITVRDTGIGIPPHACEYIFDEFRQVDQTSSRKYGGTGLGLTIVQKLARVMGGSVVVESEVGRGSVFTLTLPFEVDQAEAISA